MRMRTINKIYKHFIDTKEEAQPVSWTKSWLSTTFKRRNESHKTFPRERRRFKMRKTEKRDFPMNQKKSFSHPSRSRNLFKCPLKASLRINNIGTARSRCWSPWNYWHWIIEKRKRQKSSFYSLAPFQLPLDVVFFSHFKETGDTLMPKKVKMISRRTFCCFQFSLWNLLHKFQFVREGERERSTFRCLVYCRTKIEYNRNSDARRMKKSHRNVPWHDWQRTQNPSRRAKKG